MKCVECGNNTDGKKWGCRYWCALCEFREEENMRDEEEYRGTEEGNSEEGGRLDGEGKLQHIRLNEEDMAWIDEVLTRLPVMTTRSELIRIIINDYMDLFGGKMKFEIE